MNEGRGGKGEERRKKTKWCISNGVAGGEGFVQEARP